MRSRRLRALAALALVGLPAGCAPTPGPPRPGTGLVVVVVDGLRADHASYGEHEGERRTTPRLARLAREGVRFDQAFSSSPSLVPAHVGLLTGCAPPIARRLVGPDLVASPESRWRIPQEAPRLAVELLARGYRTAAFMDHPRLAPLHGFGAGFEEFVAAEGDGETPRRQPTTRRTIDLFLQWLRSIGRDESWFAYVHLDDLERLWLSPDPRWDDFFQPEEGRTHVPPLGATDSVFFTVPRSLWTGGVRTVAKYEAMYDGHVRRIDGELDRMLANLEVLGRYDTTTVVVVGSTGMQFGEAGLYLGSGLYSMADLHVPWVLKPDAGLALPAGVVHRGVVSTLDLSPTLLELCGLPVPPGTHGRSLAALLREPPAAEPPERVVYASCGLLEGCVAIGPRYVYELTNPEGAEVELRRSWFGSARDWSPDHARFYDRLEDPYPPLGANVLGFVPSVPGEAEVLERMAADAAEWTRRVGLARRVLQLGLAEGLENGDTAPIEELRRLGYLGP